MDGPIERVEGSHLRYTGAFYRPGVIGVMIERRDYPRIRRKRKVGFLLSDGTMEYLWTLDISRCGMRLHTQHLVDVGAQFSVMFGVYDYDLEDYTRVQALLEIVHKVYDSANGGFRLGGRFVQFEGDGEDVYHRHVRELEKQLL